MSKKIIIIFWISISFLVNSCGGKIPGADARKVSPDPKERVKKNLEEGKGFRLSESLGGNNSGTFEFATSNELWRASLDALDFMPLASVNYSGGIIITDWYSDNSTPNESIKIIIRFLTNEIRSDALKIIVHERICNNNNCVTSLIDSKISNEIQLAILKKATLMEKESIEELVKERRKKDPRGGDNAIPQDQR